MNEEAREASTCEVHQVFKWRRHFEAIATASSAGLVPAMAVAELAAPLCAFKASRRTFTCPLPGLHLPSA